MRISRPLLVVAAVLGTVVGLAQPAAAAAPTTVVVQPGQSVADALNKVASGGSVLLLPGTHRPATVTGRAWAQTVTLRPVDGAEGQVELGELNLRDLQNLTITDVRTRGLVTIDGGAGITVASSPPAGVLVKTGAHDVTIRDNTIVGGWNGVAVHGYPGTPRPHHVRIVGNRISGQENDNIQIGIAHDISVENNLLVGGPDNTNHNDGVQFMGGERLVIRGNWITGQDQSVLLKSETWMGDDDAIIDARIEGNVIYRPREFGVILLGTTGTTVVHNVVYDTPKVSVLFTGNNVGAVVTANVIQWLFVERTATPPTVQAGNCILSGGTAADRPCPGLAT